MSDSFNDIQSRIEVKEIEISVLRRKLATLHPDSGGDVKKFFLEQEIGELRSEVLLLRKRLTRIPIDENLLNIKKDDDNFSNDLLYRNTRVQLEKGDVLEAIEELKKVMFNKKQLDEVLLIKGQFSSVRNDFLKGLISFEQLTVETNRIMAFIVSKISDK